MGSSDCMCPEWWGGPGHALTCPQCVRYVTENNYEKPTNPKDRAATSRLDLSLVPQSAIVYMALALTEGDAKYGGFNWRDAGVRVSVCFAACMRHLFKFYNGEDADPKTNVPHLASAMACLAVVVDSIQQGNVVDDRPPKQDVGQLLDRCEEIVKHLHTMFPDGPARHTEKKQ